MFDLEFDFPPRAHCLSRWWVFNIVMSSKFSILYFMFLVRVWKEKTHFDHFWDIKGYGWLLRWPIGGTSASHQCGLGSIPGWGSDPGAVSEKGISPPVWATLHQGRRWKVLLTYSAGIRSPVGNQTRAALVRGRLLPIGHLSTHAVDTFNLLHTCKNTFTTETKGI